MLYLTLQILYLYFFYYLKGQYVLVFGEIEKLLPESLIIKAMKISDLTDNKLLKEMWPLDVQEAKLIYSNLGGKKEPI